MPLNQAPTFISMGSISRVETTFNRDISQDRSNVVSEKMYIKRSFVLRYLQIGILYIKA